MLAQRTRSLSAFLLLALLGAFAHGQVAPPEDLSGSALRTWLKQNWYDGLHDSQGYSGTGSSRWHMYSSIDQDENGMLTCVYSGFMEPGCTCTFPDPTNAEHTVPQSFFDEDEPMKSDIHHLFPTHGSVNSARGNRPFGEVVDTQADLWYGNDNGSYATQTTVPDASVIDGFSERDGDVFEPREAHKGNVARAVFYFYTMYPSYDIAQVGDLETFYMWHLLDPVDEVEAERNDETEAVQDNRNPYIDHPNMAAQAWGLTVTVSADMDAIDFGTTAFGTPSDAQAVQVTTSNLYGPLTLTAPEHFEISADGTAYGSELELMPAVGALDETVFVRFNPEIAFNGDETGELTLDAPYVDGATVMLMGTESSAVDPLVIAEPNALVFPAVVFGETGDCVSYELQGAALTGELTLTASEGFEVSEDGASYATSLTLAPDGNGAVEETVCVRFSPTANATASVLGTVEHAGGGLAQAVTVNLDAASIEFTEPPVTGLDGLESEAFALYPNPVGDRLHVSHADGGDLKLYDALGRLALSARLPQGQNETTLSLAGLEPGAYVAVLTRNGEVTRRKLLKD